MRTNDIIIFGWRGDEFDLKINALKQILVIKVSQNFVVCGHQPV